MMKKNVFVLFLMMFFSLTISAQTTKDYKPELDLIYKSFKEKNFELLKPLLDPNVKIGDLPTGMNDMIIPQIMEQFPEPTSYTVNKTVTEGDNVRIETLYKNTMMPEGFNWKFTFNKDGKIIDLDILSDVMTDVQQNVE